MTPVKACDLKLGDVLIDPITREPAGTVTDLREWDGRIWMNTDPALRLSHAYVYGKYTRFQVQDR